MKEIIEWVKILKEYFILMLFRERRKVGNLKINDGRSIEMVVKKDK